MHTYMARFFFPYMQRLDETRTERWRGDTVEKGQIWMRITEMVFFFLKFIYLCERERACASSGGSVRERERKRESFKQT